MIWVVAGVWAVRRVWGRPPGLAWAVACIGAASKWGAMDLGGVQAATRLLGPTVAVGPAVAAAGATVALVAALVEESAADGLRSSAPPVRATAVVALMLLVPLFVAPGAGRPWMAASLAWWMGAAAIGAAVSTAAAPWTARVPPWIPVVASLAGVVAMGWPR